MLRVRGIHVFHDSLVRRDRGLFLHVRWGRRRARPGERRARPCAAHCRVRRLGVRSPVRLGQ
jgi:hypothetical protein